LKFRFSAIFRLVFLFFLFPSCNFGAFWLEFGEESVESRARVLVDLGDLKQNPSVSGSVFSFVALTDCHFGSSRVGRRDDEFLSAFGELFSCADESMRPSFAVCLGDIADGGRQGEYDDYNAFAEKISAAGKKSLGTDEFFVYGIPGNHDTYHGGISRFMDSVFPHATYYRFSAGGVSFYCLDTANGTLGYNQLSDLTRQMENDGRQKIVMTHYPIYAGGNFLMTMQDSSERNLLVTLFRKNGVRQVYEGHAHRPYGFDYKSFREDVLSAYLYDSVFYLVTVDCRSGGRASVTTRAVEF